MSLEVVMSNEILELKTNSALLNALHNSLLKKPTAEEIMEQRVSFVFSSLNSGSSVTRDRVRKLLAEQEGIAA